MGTEIPESRAHFCGSSCGEGHGKYVVRVIDTRGYAVGNPVGDGPCLTRSRTGKDSYWAAQRGGCLPLFSVEAGEDVFWSLQSNSLKSWVVARVHRTSG